MRALQCSRHFSMQHHSVIQGIKHSVALHTSQFGAVVSCNVGNTLYWWGGILIYHYQTSMFPYLCHGLGCCGLLISCFILQVFPRVSCCYFLRPSYLCSQCLCVWFPQHLCHINLISAALFSMSPHLHFIPMLVKFVLSPVLVGLFSFLMDLLMDYWTVFFFFFLRFWNLQLRSLELAFCCFILPALLSAFGSASFCKLWRHLEKRICRICTTMLYCKCYVVTHFYLYQETAAPAIVISINCGALGQAVNNAPLANLCEIKKKQQKKQKHFYTTNSQCRCHPWCTLTDRLPHHVWDRVTWWLYTCCVHSGQLHLWSVYTENRMMTSVRSLRTHTNTHTHTRTHTHSSNIDTMCVLYDTTQFVPMSLQQVLLTTSLSLRYPLGWLMNLLSKLA